MPKLIKKPSGNQTAENVAAARKVFEDSLFRTNGMQLKYEEFANPTETGVYAVRRPVGKTELVCDDLFLTWMNSEKRWYYTGSGERYRGKIAGWIGPLPRLHIEPVNPF